MCAVEDVGHKAHITEEVTGFPVAHLIAGGTVDVIEGSLRRAALGNPTQIPHVCSFRQTGGSAVKVGSLEPHEILELGDVGQLAL